MSILVLDPVPVNPSLLEIARASGVGGLAMNAILDRLVNPPAMVSVKSEIVDQFGHPIWIDRPYHGMLAGMTWKEQISGDE